MVTIREVAEQAGVSVATVSYVINGTRRVAPDTLARVRRAMAELDYQPNSVAQSLRTRTTHVIGVLVSDITNPFFATLVRGVEDAAVAAGYSLLVCNSDEDLIKGNAYMRLLLRRRMDGLLIAPVRDGASPAIQELAKRRMPFVFIDRRAAGVPADAVLSDNVGGAYQATRHLIERGHRRIGIVLGIPGATTTEERFAGYRQALEEAGIPFVEELVAWGGYRIEGGQRAAAQLLSRPEPPTAIFSTNNQMTVGVLRELFLRRIPIPDKVAVVGFDDLELAEMVIPPLTVVAQDPYEIGQRAFELLLERLDDPGAGGSREIRVPVELRVRGST
ncbi:MAG: LacI family transcriptional regulator [Candidatus Acetothermia bacterium]|jgi:LacI family transcriptional regulator|nr:LacI family transcriptional regulator [Candidatus Acetothermia bacterium]MDH7505417.1 LacI family DNA-binding transcriptional regulator [Candidatus Acetothermia bacterium]